MDTAAIASRACPVLCLDTCSLLDIMRDPTRETARPADRQIAFELATAIETGRLTCLVAEQVNVEFSEHDQRIQDEAEQKLRKLRDQVDRVNSLAQLYGVTGTVNLAHLDDHVTRARALVERYLVRAIVAQPSAEAPGRAFARLNKGIAPARKGKDSSKDCLVYETYLEVITSLRGRGLTSAIVFLSSNINDYRDGQELRAEVSADFQSLNIQFAATIGHAKYLLGL